MSDARRVESDTRAVAAMRALADTIGMSPPEQAAYWLEKIAEAVHRGPRRDTWTSARDRAAAIAGIEASMAKRIWQRWQEMKDVSGEALIKLMVAYEAIYAGEGTNDFQDSVERSRLMGKAATAVEAIEARSGRERRRAQARPVDFAGVAGDRSAHARV